MVELASNLRALEALLEEFFGPQTGNARKQEIEKVLGAFTSQPTAWRDCLYFLSHSGNHFVAMFSLTTLETFIHRRWVGMLGVDRAEIRTSLHRLLFQHHASTPQFIRNKLIKLMVDIARSDWPHFYPDFFMQLMSLVKGGESTSLGLTMLLTASEELATPREDIATTRSVELRRLMTAEVEEVAVALTLLLEGAIAGDIGHCTPPPSPDLSNDSEDSVNSMEEKTEKISGNGGLRRAPPPSLDGAARQVAGQALACLAHIFTWAPLHCVVSSKLIHVLFQYAGLTVRAPQDDTLSELSVLAITAVTEIIYKSYVPADLNSYLLILFKNAFHILQTLVAEPSLTATLSETYVEKLTEFLRQFVASHLRRLVDHSSFPLVDFLSLLFQFTFLQKSPEALLACLEVWAAVCDYLEGSKEAGKGEVIGRYTEALAALVTELLRRLQQRHHAVLASLDHERIGEDGTTEWQAFLNACLELVMRIAELLPEQTLATVEVVWRDTSAAYLQLENQVEESNGERRLSAAAHHAEVKVLLRDHCSLLQLCGRLCSLFLGSEFLPRLSRGLNMVKQLLLLAVTGARLRLWTLAGIGSLAGSFEEAQAATLAALQAWCHWLAALHSEALQDSSHTWVCSDLTSRIVVATVAGLREGEGRLSHAASHFLVTLTGTVRPPSIWKVKEFTDLYTSLPRSQLSLSTEGHRLTVRALCNVLLLHWPGMAVHEQKWDERAKHLAKFLRDLTEPFRSLKSSPALPSSPALQSEAAPCIVITLQMLGDLVENVLNEVTQSKKLCHDVTREYIELALWLFPLYVSCPKVCHHMFNFFHTVFDVLSAQMGSDFVERAVHTFFNLFGQNLLAEVGAQQSASLESRVIESFLSILTFIVAEPGPSFRKFVPSTLSLCLDQLFPLVQGQGGGELRPPLYKLLRTILTHNWTFFFKPSLPGVTKQLAGQGEEHKEQFVAVMRAIGQSFLQQDIEVFRDNIGTLELLNSKWRLYSRAAFKETLLAEFLSVLIQVLVAKSHNLLREEIGVCVFHMAVTDLPSFSVTFLPSLLHRLEGLDDNQRQCLVGAFRAESDLPSFLSSLERLVTDTRYYQLVNASVDQPVRL